MAANREHYKRARERYVAWLALTPAERKRLGEPTSNRQWAKLHGVGESTLDGWRKNPEVQAEVAALQAQKVAQAGGTLPAEPSGPGAAVGSDVSHLESMSNVELLAQIVRNALIGAAQGHKDALDYLRANQAALKPLVDAIHQDFESDWEGASDEELVAKFVDTFESEAVAELRDRGWTVVRADGEVETLAG